MNTQAIRKLKRSFVTSAMISVALVMLFMGSLIFVGNVAVDRRETSAILDIIIDHDGDLPRDSSLDFYVSDTVGSFLLRRLSPESLYAIRYFSAHFEEDGSLIRLASGHVATITKKEAEKMARAALEAKKRFGSRGTYLYKVRTLSDGTVMAAFVDITQQRISNQRIIYISLILGILGLLITFFLVNLFSNRLVAPEIEAARRQKQFITNASHELKTPLAVIRANTEIEEMMGGETEWTRSTMRQLDRLSVLIQNLVLIARSAEQANDAVLSDTDVTKILSETAASFRPVAEQDGKTFEIHIPDGIRMRAEESQLRQLASLLIDNAIKYCDADGTITVAAGKRGKTLRLNVSNSYKDGASVDYSRFFDRFYREDRARTGGTGGYGIGLSIAEGLVHQYKGSISASFRDGVISFSCVLTDRGR